MALPALASTTDLSNRGVPVDNVNLATTMLGVASSVVRQAAGSSITETTGTISTWVFSNDTWLDLPKLTTAVSAVAVEDAPVTDYKLMGHRLWRKGGWGSLCGDPVSVRVTLTAGYATAPQWVVQLVCDLAILGMKTAGEGAQDPRVWVESIDDYRVTFNQKTGDQLASAMELPAATRNALAAAFGGSASMVMFT